MDILVTGANGYLGKGIVEELLNLDHQVMAADYSTENIDDRAKKCCVDIFNIEDPYLYFEKPDVVLHLAWKNGFVHNADNHIKDIYFHDKFLKDMIDGGVNTMCIMGSMHEIGFYEGSIDEHTPCKPMNMYGIAKNALRQSIELYAAEKNVNFIWLRGFYIVGTDVKGNSIFSKIAAANEKGQEEFPFTMGLNQYDFLDYKDFCVQTAKAVTQSKETGIINICSGRPETLASRVERFIKENNYNIKLKYGAFPDRKYDSKAIWGDSRKIERILSNN